MYPRLFLCVWMILFATVMAAAEDVKADNPSTAVVETAGDVKADNPSTAVAEAADDVNAEKASTAKELSGMSIVGNDEAPKSLYIVPWKGSDLGAETSLDMAFDEGDVPVDKDVFKRQIDFYEISTKQ